jgi:hypothetical protein
MVSVGSTVVVTFFLKSVVVIIPVSVSQVYTTQRTIKMSPNTADCLNTICHITYFPCKRSNYNITTMTRSHQKLHNPGRFV